MFAVAGRWRCRSTPASAGGQQMDAAVDEYFRVHLLVICCSSTAKNRKILRRLSIFGFLVRRVDMLIDRCDQHVINLQSSAPPTRPFNPEGEHP
jgi:hypothetical protein